MSEASIAQLIAQLQQQRRFWLTLSESPARKLEIARPTEAQMAVLRTYAGMELYQAYADMVVDWKGFSLADLGGESQERMPFSRAAWDALWPDSLHWLALVGEAANKAFVEREQQQADAEKN
jgi:hypothetical protein